MDKGKAEGSGEPELVSRSVQSGVGLLIGVSVYGAALGGLFAIAFALAYGRMGDFGLRATAALLAVAGFVAVASGAGAEISRRAAGRRDSRDDRLAHEPLFRLSLHLARRDDRRGRPAASALRAARRTEGGALAGAAYIAVMLLVGLGAASGQTRRPKGFPADLLWQFRAASLAGQALMWAALGLGFGEAAERLSRAKRMCFARNFAEGKRNRAP